jgi:hypothetical protein
VSYLLIKCCKYLVLRVNLGTRCSLKTSKNMNKRATKHKSATENYILKFLTVSYVSSDMMFTLSDFPFDFDTIVNEYLIGLRCLKTTWNI